MTDLYDKMLGNFLEELPFAVYAKPRSTTVTGVFQVDKAIYETNDFTGNGFVFAPFAKGTTVFIPFEKADVIVTEAPEGNNAASEFPEITVDPVAKASFEALVSKSVDAIKSGQFDKLVTSRSENVEHTTSPFAIYSRLLNTYPNAFRYCFYSPATGMWMGATPEQLLKAENNTVHTVALAGTQLFDAENKAVWEDKEKQEQQFVTNYILSELAEFTTAMQQTEPYTFRAGNIVHIKTDISAELKEGTQLSAVINKLHPTPAVCGLPKAKAKQFLLENEGYDREYYSGFLGELNHDFVTGQPKTDLFVNLRSLKLRSNSAQLFIGCGITRDSDPEKEFIETVNKSVTMRKVL